MAPAPAVSLEIPMMPASAMPPAASAAAPIAQEPDAVEVDPAKTASVAPRPPPGTASAPFDSGAAASAISKVHPQACSQPGGPTGPGHVTLTFAPLTGRVANVVLDGGSFARTPTGTCIMQAYGRLSVPPFRGAAVRVGKSFTLP